MKEKRIKSYVVGFTLSVILTLTAYFIVANHIFDGAILTFAILGLAFLQLIVQLVFFLHLTDESGPRWKLIFFFSTISIILLVMVGSLWIMHHLNYNMTPMEMNNSIMENEGIK